MEVSFVKNLIGLCVLMFPASIACHKVVLQCFECSWEVNGSVESGQSACGQDFQHQQANRIICNGYCQKIETFVLDSVKSVERSCVPSCAEQIVGDKVTKCCHDKDLCNHAPGTETSNILTITLVIYLFVML